ncbi:MAG: hypothetical protein COB69_04480 [Phycisphaera sp.]|nr:MAG: hypothetical protein COB69_04480 [Phycisphaera sp.]
MRVRPLDLGSAANRYLLCMRTRSGHNPSILPDPGWLFLIAGLAILGSAVLIPASEALVGARYARDRALVSETFRLDRIARYEAVIGELDERQPTLMAHLRAVQLNQYPEGMRPLGEPTEDPALASASIFDKLEPPLPAMPDEPIHRTERSFLAKLATGQPSRLWMLAGGAVSVLIGVLPPVSRHRTRRKRSRAGQATVCL